MRLEQRISIFNHPKTDFFHELVTRLFIIRFNLDKLSLTT